jgi:hypothetical protein
MTNTAIPLRDLAQRISRQQAELEKLRQEYKARQTQMHELTRRKEQLQAQLQQVDAELRDLDEGRVPVPKTAPAATAATKPLAKPTAAVSLAQLVVRIVSKNGGPLTLRELTREVERQKYPTTSNNLFGLVKKRVSELVKKGLLRRAKNHLGVLPSRGLDSPAAKPKNFMAVTKPKSAHVEKSTPATLPVVAKDGLSLHSIVTKVLAKSPHPLSARELADRVLRTGYKTQSKDFTNVIWSGIGKMANIENVPGKGYQLKKTKAKFSASKRKGLK